MVAKYIDLTDAAPISTTTGDVQNLADNIWSGIFRNWNRFSTGNFHQHRVEAGEISERKLKFGSSNSSCITQYLNITNNTDKHIVAMGLKWNNNDGGVTWNNTTTARYMPVVGWNAACTALTANSQTATNLVSISGDGKVRCNGVESAINTVPVNTYVYFETEIDPSTGIVNVYVNKTLAVTTTISGFTALNQLGIVCNTGASDGTTNYFLHTDDLIVMDKTGAAPFNALFTDFVQVKRLPLLAQSETHFSTVGAASGIAAVNKQTLDGTSFNRSTSSNDVGDFFTLDTTALDGTETIMALGLASFVRKTDLGVRAIDIAMKDATHEVDQSVDGLDTSFKGPITPFIKPLQPDGATSWTKAALDAIKVGYIVRES